MLCATPQAFRAQAGSRGALLALDPGAKTIGVAVCDEDRGHASPLETIRRSKLTHDLSRLREIADARAASGLVIGMPLNMDGSAGRRAQSVRAFSRHVEDTLRLPVLYWDERLSSFAAEEAMIEAGVKRAQRAARIDAMAAVEILRGALARLAELPPDA